MRLHQAIILRHPHCPAPILEAPPQDTASIISAWRASNAERLKLRQLGIEIPLHPLPEGITPADVAALAPLPQEKTFKRLDALEAISRLVEEHGPVQVRQWVRRIARLRKREAM